LRSVASASAATASRCIKAKLDNRRNMSIFSAWFLSLGPQVPSMVARRNERSSSSVVDAGNEHRTKADRLIGGSALDPIALSFAASFSSSCSFSFSFSWTACRDHHCLRRSVRNRLPPLLACPRQSSRQPSHPAHSNAYATIKSSLCCTPEVQRSAHLAHLVCERTGFQSPFASGSSASLVNPFSYFVTWAARDSAISKSEPCT